MGKVFVGPVFALTTLDPFLVWGGPHILYYTEGKLCFHPGCLSSFPKFLTSRIADHEIVTCLAVSKNELVILPHVLILTSKIHHIISGKDIGKLTNTLHGYTNLHFIYTN
ncbi:hypothetical protein C0J52_12640 [Blattella germanica]|nr:hypothetical protein C0J52_12640 [Blattella germanica]